MSSRFKFLLIAMLLIATPLKVLAGSGAMPCLSSLQSGSQMVETVVAGEMHEHTAADPHAGHDMAHGGEHGEAMSASTEGAVPSSVHDHHKGFAKCGFCAGHCGAALAAPAAFLQPGALAPAGLSEALDAHFSSAAVRTAERPPRLS